MTPPHTGAVPGETGGSGLGLTWTEPCPLCDSGTPPDLGPLLGDCVAVEGNGCTLGACAPPTPRCEQDGVPGLGEDSGVEWVGSPSVCGLADAAPSLAAPLLALVLALVRRTPALLVLLVALTVPEARAFDVDRMSYSDGRGWAAIVDGDTGRPWQARAALSGSVLSRPLVARYADGDVFPIVGLASTAALGASMTFDPRIRVGVVLPVHPIAVDGVGNSLTMVPGDATVAIAVPLSDRDARLQGSWQVGGELPTGDAVRFLGGLGSVHGTFAARLGGGAGSRSAFGAQLGLRLRPDELLSATRWGNAVEYGLAGAIRPLTALELALEGFGALGLRGETRANLPLEWLFAARWPAEARASLRLGVGGGIGRGLGNPRIRGLLALELASDPARDSDDDGYVDLRDLCRRRPEDRDDYRDLDGCPDVDDDDDGFLDPDDACRLEPETVNGWRDADGCPDRRAELAVEVGPSTVEAASVRIDGLPPFTTLPGLPRAVEVDPGLLRLEVTAEGFEAQQVVRTVGEGPTRIVVRLVPLPSGALTVRVRDASGAPVAAEVRVVPVRDEIPDEAGARRVAVPEGEAVVPFAAGPVAVVAEAPGYVAGRVLAEAPAEGTADVEVVLHRPAVALVGRQVVVGEQVRFDVDRAEPTAGSDPALDALARWLQERPDIELLRVEGHADDPGAPRYNLELSQRRADAVVAALVLRGVAPERLVALGSGESVRLSAPESERVVEFLVLVWDEEGDR